MNVIQMRDDDVLPAGTEIALGASVRNFFSMNRVDVVLQLGDALEGRPAKGTLILDGFFCLGFFDSFALIRKYRYVSDAIHGIDVTQRRDPMLGSQMPEDVMLPVGRVGTFGAFIGNRFRLIRVDVVLQLGEERGTISLRIVGSRGGFGFRRRRVAVEVIEIDDGAGKGLRFR